MNKYTYRLICKGKSDYFIFLGRPYKLSKPQDRLFYSKPKSIYAKDEEIARVEIREQLKNKWSAFIIDKEEKL